jgi:hypothetical protein
MASGDPGRFGLAGFLLVGDDAPAEPLRDLREEGVPEGSKAVHPAGNPMSHSTHVGFNCPVTTLTPWDCKPERQFAVGVGIMPRSTALTITVSDVIVLRGPPFIRCFIAMCASGVFPSSRATGVGHNPDPVAPVRGANGRSRDAVPFRVIPARGQVAENTSESPRTES